MPGPVFDHDLEMLNERSTLDEGMIRACHATTLLLAYALNLVSCGKPETFRMSRYTIMVLKVTFLDGGLAD